MVSLNLPVNIPLLNPNEPEARLVTLPISEGQYVNKGELLCTLETTKSTEEIYAETEGYIVALQFSEGDTAVAGAKLCYLAESKDWRPEEVQIESIPQTAKKPDIEIPPGLRISQPALLLADSNNLDLNQLPKGPMVTENMIKDFVEKSDQYEIPESEFDPSAVIVYGGGGHGKSVIDTIRSQNIFQIHGIVDDGLSSGESVMGFPILGGNDILPELFIQGIRLAVNAVGGIGDIASRRKVFHKLAANGFACPAIVHPSSVIEQSVITSAGIQVFPQTYIGSEVQIGYGVIINTGAVVSHDCILDDYANISPGALLAGGVKIGKGTLVGMGVTINLGINIGNNARIGNSATIKADVPDNGIVRAGMSWPD
jgi:sugar O-acyltransferase (sialic acid O-acetyltransferase NeuD family)